MFTLQVTQDAADKFQDGLDKWESSNPNIGIFVRPSARVPGNPDYAITDDSFGFSSSVVTGVKFYFHSELPDETWEVDHDGSSYMSIKVS